MPETTNRKKLTKAESVINNSLTRTRMVIIRFLKSMFEEDNVFPYKANKDGTHHKESEILIFDRFSDQSDMEEKRPRLIFRRNNIQGRALAYSQTVEHSDNLHEWSTIKPRLGVVSIFCEARKPEEAEYLATMVETAFSLLRAEIMEKGIIVSEPSTSDTERPISGGGFYSLEVRIPVTTQEVISLETKNRQMLSDVDIAITGNDSVMTPIET